MRGLVPGPDYLTALDLIARCRTRLTAAAAGYDALLVPLLQLAPRGATGQITTGAVDRLMLGLV